MTVPLPALHPRTSGLKKGGVYPPDVWPEAGALVGETGSDFTAGLSRGSRGHGWRHRSQH